ncbi:3-dehydroquinate synthase [Lachnospiraceae bacterium 46-61]
MESIFVTTPDKTYPILFEQSFESLADSIKKQHIAGRRMCIIADENTHQLYCEEVKKQLEKVSENVYCYHFTAGEKYKNLETINHFYEFFQQNRFDRKTVVVALGGGVCGDMAGFAAATYLRGIPFIQIPTTLLSQVDSSVGGKTGVDFNGAKNSIGAFYQPELVYINTATLKTLPKREFSAGMAEVIKYGCILSNDFINYLENHKKSILSMQHDVLIEMIRQCCLFKADVVSKDEKESGLREILNFGHTIGHAIETIFNFQMLHGECVALGMLAVLELAVKQGNITQHQLEQIQQLLCYFDLPLFVSDVSKEKVYQQMFLDKKVNQNKIRFVLPKRIGEVYTTSELSEYDIMKAIEFVVK